HQRCGDPREVAGRADRSHDAHRAGSRDPLAARLCSGEPQFRARGDRQSVGSVGIEIKRRRQRREVGRGGDIALDLDGPVTRHRGAVHLVGTDPQRTSAGHRKERHAGGKGHGREDGGQVGRLRDRIRSDGDGARAAHLHARDLLGAEAEHGTRGKIGDAVHLG
ncbi:MAG: hypothetical protein ACK559_35660, partial [bacterium]